LGDGDPRIAVGGVQPAAAEIDCRSRAIADRPRPPAEPWPRLDDETIDPRVREAAPGGDSCRAAADDHYLGVAAGQGVFGDDLGRVASNPAPRGAPPHEPSRCPARLMLVAPRVLGGGWGYYADSQIFPGGRSGACRRARRAERAHDGGFGRAGGG